MKKLFSKIREDTCVRCGRNRAIELYDKNDSPINFSFILDKGSYFLLDCRHVYYGKCKNCGEVFSLDWRNPGKIPRLLNDINFQIYIQQYSKSKIV